MLVRASIRSPSAQNGTRLFSVSAVAALLMLSVVGVDVSTGAARSLIARPDQSTAATVQRARKADRLMPAPAVKPDNHEHPRQVPAAASKLREGCEPSVSPLARTEWSSVAVRCLS
jgi:hypothetical protein